jgi:hypothetical protein
MIEERVYRVEVGAPPDWLVAYCLEIHGKSNTKPVAAPFNLFRLPEQGLAAGRRALAKS